MGVRMRMSGQNSIGRTERNNGGPPTFIANHGFVLARKSSDKGGGVGGFQRRGNSLPICPQIPQFHIFHDGQLKKFWMLKDDGKLPPEPVHVQTTDVTTIEEYATAETRKWWVGRGLVNRYCY